MIEQNLPENIDRRAIKAGLRCGEVCSALEFARKAEALILGRKHHVCAPDPSTVMAVRPAVRLLQLELADANRLREAIEALADEKAAA